MKTRIIYTKFWQDSYISGLSHKEKLLFLYLFTNEKVNLVGIYELPDKYIKADLELSQKELDDLKVKFQQDHKFYFFEGFIKIVNIDKYNNFTGEKNEIAKNKELVMISDTVLEELDRVSIGYPMGIDTLHNHNHKSVINNVEEKKEKYAPDFFTSKEFHKLILDSFPKYRLEPKDVFAYYPKIKDYEASKGKKYKDYVATTRNWVRTDIEKGKYRTFVDDDEKERFMKQFYLLVD